MNGRERIALAMQNREPDRVPVMCQLALGHYFLNSGIPAREIWFTSEGFAEALVSLQRRYRFDGILINLPGRPAGLLHDIANVETAADGEWLAWRDGSRTFVPHDDNPHHFPAGGGDLPRFDFMAMGVDDLDRLDTFTGYLWNIYHMPRLPGKAHQGPLDAIPDYFFNTIDLVREKTGGEVSVHGEVFSPFTHLMELIGYENGLMSLIMDADKAHGLLDRLTGPAVAWAVAQAERGVDAVLISSAFAGGPLLSPKMYDTFVAPYEARVAEAVRATGVPVYTHTCGSIGDRLEAMVATGTMGIDTLDPPPLGNVELTDAKQRIGSQAFIKGNMDSVALLKFKTEDEVRAHVLDRLQAGMPGGGYILSSACSVAPRVEPWKLEMLTPLAEAHGQYG